jgi:hypothetical protein
MALKLRREDSSSERIFCRVCQDNACLSGAREITKFKFTASMQSGFEKRVLKSHHQLEVMVYLRINGGLYHICTIYCKAVISTILENVKIAVTSMV